MGWQDEKKKPYQMPQDEFDRALRVARDRYQRERPAEDIEPSWGAVPTQQESQQQRATLSKSILDRVDALKSHAIMRLGGTAQPESLIEPIWAEARSKVLAAPHDAPAIIRNAIMAHDKKAGLSLGEEVSGLYSKWLFSGETSRPKEAGRTDELLSGAHFQALQKLADEYKAKYAPQQSAPQQAPGAQQPPQAGGASTAAQQDAIKTAGEMTATALGVHNTPVHAETEQAVAQHFTDIIKTVRDLPGAISETFKDMGGDHATMAHELADHQMRGGPMPSKAEEVARFLMYAVTLGPKQALGIFAQERHARQQEQLAGTQKPMTEYQRDTLKQRAAQGDQQAKEFLIRERERESEFSQRQSFTEGRYGQAERERMGRAAAQVQMLPVHEVERRLAALNNPMRTMPLTDQEKAEIPLLQKRLEEAKADYAKAAMSPWYRR